MVLLVYLIGVAPTVAGVGLMLIIFYINLKLGKLSGKLEKKNLGYASARMGIMNEIINGIKVGACVLPVAVSPTVSSLLCVHSFPCV